METRQNAGVIEIGKNNRTAQNVYTHSKIEETGDEEQSFPTPQSTELPPLAEVRGLQTQDRVGLTLLLLSEEKDFLSRSPSRKRISIE